MDRFPLTVGRTLWYRRFRTAAYVNAVVWLVWTVAILLPFEPFSDLQPIMVGGGAATWLLLGYTLFVTIAVIGFVGISSLIFIIETHENRTFNNAVMLIGFILLYLGTVVGLLLLGVAGASGGYALVIQHSTLNTAQNILSPYVNAITASSIVAVTGTGLTIYGAATAKATNP